MGLVNSGGNIKSSTFIRTIEITTDLRLVFLVVCGIRWFFDFCYMTSFCNISTPLYCCSILTDAGSDTLKKFKLGNVPVVDDEQRSALCT